MVVSRMIDWLISTFGHHLEGPALASPFYALPAIPAFPIPSWLVLVIGFVLSVILIGLLIWFLVAQIRRRRSARPTYQKSGYLLQVSQDRLICSRQQSALLTASAWRSDSEGSYRRAMDILMQISGPPQVQVTHLTAPAGTLRVQLVPAPGIQSGEFDLSVTAQLPNHQTLSKTVILSVEEPYRVEFITEQGSPAPDVHQFVFGPETRSWKPLTLRARVTNGTHILNLRPDFLVVDGSPTPAWINHKKLEVRNMTLGNENKIAQFTLQPALSLTLDDLLQNRGRCILKAALTPAMTGTAITYEGQCELSIPLPLEIATNQSVRAAQLDGKPGTYLFVRLNLFTPATDPVTLKGYQDKLQIQADENLVVTDAERTESHGWRCFHIYPAPASQDSSPDQPVSSSTGPPENQSVYISAQVGYETLKKTVQLNFGPEPIRLDIQPEYIQMDDQADKPVRVFGVLELSSYSLTPAEVQTALDSLTIEIDEASRPWLAVSGPLYELSGASPYAVWMVSGKIAGQEGTPAGPPAVARVTLRGRVRNQAVRQEGVILLGGPYQARIQLTALVKGAKTAEVRYVRPEFGEPHWDLPNITYSFSKPGEEYFPQPFKDYVHVLPQAQPDQPALAFSPPQASLDSELVREIPVQLAGSDDIDQSAGSIWLERDGKVQVSLRIGQTKPLPQELKDTITYHFVPSARLVAYPCDENGLGEPAQGHTYLLQAKPEAKPPSPAEASASCCAISLGEGEFVADGTDRLYIAAGFRRSDWPTPSPQDKRILPYGRIEQYDVTIKVDQVPNDDFDVQLYPSTVAGLFLISVRSRKPLLAGQFVRPAISSTDQTAQPALAQRTLGAVAGKVTLHITGRLNEAPPSYEVESLETEIELKPRYLSGQLWVIPGRYRDSASVCLLTYLAPHPKDVLPGIKTRLTVRNLVLESKTEASPKPEDIPRLELYGPDLVQTDRMGCAQWELFYRGLTWQNLDKAVFEISGSIEDYKGNSVAADFFTIHVRENIASLLKDLFQERTGLSLTNPFFRQPEFYQQLRLFSWRPYLRGPLLTLLADRIQASGAAQSPETASPSLDTAGFASPQIRDRVAAWLFKRRHYQPENPSQIEKLKEMNGIDFEVFHIPGVHSWIAIFPSGMQSVENPRCLDPWWSQEWEDPRYQVLEALPDMKAEQAYSLAATTWMTLNPLPMASAMLKILRQIDPSAKLLSINEVSASIIAAAPVYASAGQSITPRQIDRNKMSCAELNQENLWTYHDITEFVSDWIREKGSE